MGKHEAPDEDQFVPEIHQKHRLMRLALNEAWRTTRDVLVGGSSIVLFEWYHLPMPVSHNTSALVEVVRYVVS